MIVLLGGQGYIGTAIQMALHNAGRSFQVLSRSSVNYADRDSLSAYLRQCGARFLINAAGFTGKPNVDACELRKAECLQGNAVLPGTIRDVCEALKLPWGHISSGCIYTGNRSDGRGFTESDPPNFSFRQNNCSFYSGTKALGEEILEGAAQCYIWRLRIPFNEVDSPRNYLTKMMRYERLLNATNSLSQLDEFAQSCLACHDRKADYGTYNLTNPGHVTTREVVDMILRHGRSNRQFSFFDSEKEFMELAARTPRSNCVLDTTRAMDAGLPMSPIEDALEAALRNWRTS